MVPSTTTGLNELERLAGPSARNLTAPQRGATELLRFNRVPSDAATRASPNQRYEPPRVTLLLTIENGAHPAIAIRMAVADHLLASGVILEVGVTVDPGGDLCLDGLRGFDGPQPA